MIPQSKIEEWKNAKAALKNAQSVLLQVELEIYDLVQLSLKEKGTNNFGKMNIVTGFTESWDQRGLNVIKENWKHNVAFPFKTELKPDGNAIKYLKENAPEAYKEVEAALTLKPKKPVFGVKE